MSYTEAKEKYAALGIDTDAAIKKLSGVPVSLHCWQGDDVRGFDTDPGKPLTGGIQTTGNYPGRARTPQELMRDIDEVLKLIPGRPKLNLHANYAIFEEGDWADRDKLEPRHFAKWVEFCKERGLGCDFYTVITGCVSTDRKRRLDGTCRIILVDHRLFYSRTGLHHYFNSRRLCHRK